MVVPMKPAQQKRARAKVQLAPMPRSVTLLGATGSIGSSTIDLLRREPELYRVEAVTANRSAAALAKLARQFARNPLPGIPAHQLKCLADLLIGNDVQVWRLFRPRAPAGRFA